MRIGVALGLIAVGAILRFAIAISVTHGLYLQTIGDILMGVGLLGLIVWVIIWAPWADDRDGLPPLPADGAYARQLNPRRSQLRRGLPALFARRGTDVVHLDQLRITFRLPPQDKPANIAAAD